MAFFIEDLKERPANRGLFTTNRHEVHPDAVAASFHEDGVVPALRVKLHDDLEPKTPARCRSPADDVGSLEERITGNPDEAHVSTSIDARRNLTVQMSMRWFTRLKNAFSRKVDDHSHALAISFVF